MSNDLSELQRRYREFIEDRDWEEFQTPKNIAEAISIEAGELLDCFLWHDNFQSEEIREDQELLEDIEEELADIVIFSLGMANELDIDIGEAIETKLDANARRFDQSEVQEINEELHKWKR